IVAERPRAEVWRRDHTAAKRSSALRVNAELSGRATASEAPLLNAPLERRVGLLNETMAASISRT
ncbi:MAG: hypothetical protein OEV27_02765, partial [Nitrospira sp.]|nr:hypothetical protein [Nitrospira sp.]